MQARGVAIDDADPPEWVRAYVSPGQMRLQRSLLWIVVMYESRTLGKAEINVAQRLHIATEGQDKKQRQLSHAEISHSTKQSPQTVVDAVGKLEGEGWVLVDRVNNRVNRYRLAWPTEDVLAKVKKTGPRCGEPTKKGPCTRTAGWGTEHKGEGKCKLHEEEPNPVQPQPLESEEDTEAAPQLQPMESDEPAEPPAELQPMELGQDDDPQTEPASTPKNGVFNSNNWSLQLQKMEPSTPTTGVLYVGALGTKKVRERSSVLAAGELTVRTARATRSAPTAQPKDHSFASRALVAEIPRYRAAPGWVRKHLAAHARAALDRGLGRDAIARYAAMVIAERTFLDHQHIPEFRGAIARLARDVAQSDACPTHGIPECPACVEDRPWTAADQADLEAALARLGITPADHTRLAQGGT